MKPSKLKRFASRPLREQILRLRFLVRHSLARVHYLPLRLYLEVPKHERVSFGWCYWPASFVPDRSVFHREWLGTDIGELRFISKAITPGMTFLDIGAYHGLYSIIAGKRVGPSGRVVAFEPSKRERRILKFHSFLNRTIPMTVEPYAVASSTGTEEFFVVGNGMEMMNSLRRPRTEASVTKRIVRSVSLDAYCELARFSRVDFIKIDVEGGELPLLQGGLATINTWRPFVICELLDWVSQCWGHTARETAIYLENLGYQWFQFREDGTVEKHQVMDHYPDDVRNFLAVPSERLDELRRINLINPSDEPIHNACNSLSTPLCFE
jgi:FkbM family methyltransferase